MSAGLLTFALGITGFGIATAVYLDHARGLANGAAAERTSPPSPSLARAPEAAPAIAGSSLPTASPRSPAELAALSPEAGKPAATPAPASPAPPAAPAAATPAASAPSPAAVAALTPPTPPPAASPVAPPPPRAAVPAPELSRTPSYWVEYGVFAVAHYAARLRDVLARSGLESVVVETHDPRGRPLLRVRSAPLGDLIAAQEAARQAETALGIAPLVHRGEPETLASAKRYWVQFGAFREAGPAARLRHRLAGAGIAAGVFSTRGTNGKSLYLVRSADLSSHANAVALAQRGQSVTQATNLIGERLEPAGQHYPPRTPPHPIVSAR
ncbi:MAG TPA: SPOR domain-containing protein [Stellaceae bacterium]|nr:SPOR domain-containing protein [Stellaceae bacterium]